MTSDLLWDQRDLKEKKGKQECRKRMVEGYRGKIEAINEAKRVLNG